MDKQRDGKKSKQGGSKIAKHIQARKVGVDVLEVNVPMLARVEGEGALHLRISGGAIEHVRLQIYEPPRFFEKFLEGRSYDEVPDLVARICGICPIAYQMSAVTALESIFGVDPGSWVYDMRRVIYLGEWLESHALHIHLLAAPDYFGYHSAIAMAQDHPEAVRRGLKLQALGNDLIKLLGARSVHPVGIKVGGFHYAPTLAQVEAMLRQLREALPDAVELVNWCAQVPIPDDPQTFNCVAMRHGSQYAIHRGELAIADGSVVPIEEYEKHFAEHHVEHSTALHSLYHGKPYLVGPLARLNLNFASLPEPVRKLAASTGVAWPSRNMFHSMLARAIEIHYAVLESIRLLENYVVPTAPAVPVTPRAGTGYGCSEAPRGILWHRYETDSAGLIVKSRIVPPTSQNQARIEEDLRLSLEAYGLDHVDDELRLHCEKVIRNYDPCISCSTHFLTLKTERR